MSSRSRSTNRRFYEAMVNLKAAAAMIFDKGIASELSKEDIAKSIQPIQKQYDDLVDLSAKEHPAEIGLAITILENNAGSLMQSSNWLKQKADQEIESAYKLRKAMIKQMTAEKQTHLEVGGFLFTLSSDGLSVELR